jgi:hypothetical protein
MDAKSLFLTANADTVYFVGGSTSARADGARDAAEALGTIDDAWWRWVIDFGMPGPDRGEGGKYLLLRRATTADSRRRLLRCALAHDEGADPGALVHGEGRSEAGGRADQEDDPDLPLRGPAASARASLSS